MSSRVGDRPQKPIEILFNQENGFEPETKPQVGMTILGDNALKIIANQSFDIPYASIADIRGKYPHSKTFRSLVLEIEFESQVLYVVAYRVLIFNHFAITNRLATEQILSEIQTKMGRTPTLTKGRRLFHLIFGYSLLVAFAVLSVELIRFLR